MPLPTTVTPADSLRAWAMGPETLTAGTGVSAATATYMEMIPVKSFKNELVDARLVTQEMIGTLVRDTSTVRLYKHNEPSFAAYQRFDKVGWLLRNLCGTPVTVAAGSTSTNNIQTFSLASTSTAGSGWLSTETFTIGIGGYVTSTIAFASTAATFVANLSPALAALPSVVSAGTTGTRNISISPGTFTASTCTFALSASNNLAHVNIPTMLITGSSATGSTSVTNSTPGVGSFQHTFTVGASGKLPTTFGEYDGVSYKIMQSGAIDTADLTLSMNDAPSWAVKAISQAEVDNQTIPTAFPNYFFSQYVGACDPSQFTLSVNSVLTATVLSGKLSCKNNRLPKNAMGGTSTDMIRPTEGVVSWSGSLNLRYTAYTGSQYANYVGNTSPGALKLRWQDTSTFIGATAGTGNNPTLDINIPNPKYNKGARLPDPAEPEQTLDFNALMDQATQTSVSFVLTNETPRYTTLT